MKFPYALGHIITLYVEQTVVRECYVASLKVKPTNWTRHRDSPHGRSPQRIKEQLQRSRGPNKDQSREQKTPINEHMVALVDLYPWLNDARIKPSKDLHPLLLHHDAHTTYMGTPLTPTDSITASQTLIENVDLFAWTACDMPGVSPKIITHRFLVYNGAQPVARPY